MTQETQVLTRDWYDKLQAQAASNFVNLPIEFRMRGYDYDFIAKSYLNFFRCEDNTRHDKLKLAKKFLNFIRSINKNRARRELSEDFFLCFEYFMENFPDLLAKQDMVHLETLEIITQAVDRSQFIQDIISVDELKRRVSNLEKTQEKEHEIISNWDEEEYITLQKERDKYLLLQEITENGLDPEPS